MAHKVETMAYAGQTPWHGLGVKVEGVKTPEEMLKLAGLDWEVERLPMVAQGKKSNFEVPRYFALSRTSDRKILGICGADWKPTQNAQAFKFFKEFTDAGDMAMDTAGSLDGGRQTWGLASIKDGFTLPGGDEVNGYLLMSNPHIWGKKIVTMFTGVRVVCNNTLQMAMTAVQAPGSTKVKKSEKGSHFAMSHVREFNDKMQEEAKATLGLAKHSLEEFKAAATLLSKKRVTKEMQDKFIAQLLQPALLKDDVVSQEDFGRNAQAVLHAVEHSPGHDMKSAKGTYWGLFNAVTFVVDHQLGRTQDSRLTSAWFGSNANLKRKALDLALDYANKA